MRGRGWAVLAGATAVAAVLVVGWWLYDNRDQEAPPDGVSVTSGRLEGRTVRVAAQTSGRIIRSEVREGDRLEEGDSIVEVDGREMRAAAAGARASVEAAEAEAAAGERRVEALEARLELARRERERYSSLVERDAAPSQALDSAEAELRSVRAELQAAEASHAFALRRIEVARAELERAEVRLEETTITAPVSGVVTAELARAGESVAPGAPVVEILEADDLKLRAYLPLEEAQRVEPGHEARIYVDAERDRFFEGVVERVADRAEFTPRDVHMPDERATLVFAVDIEVPDPEGVLKDGFPADAYIRWDSAADWPLRRPW